MDMAAGFPRPTRRRLVTLGVGLLIGAALLNALIVDHQTGRATDRGPGFVMDLPGGDLHVRVDGARAAPALVLLHGLANSSRSWDRIVPLLAGRFRVVRVDLLGHGQSDKPTSGYEPEREANGLNALVRRLGLCHPIEPGH